jgi:phosphate transport system permease protein
VATEQLSLLRATQQRRRSRPTSWIYAALLWAGVVIFALILFAIIQGIISQSTQAWGHFGISFLWSTQFNEGTNEYGAGVFIVGTLVTVALALLIAIPFGLATASYLTEMAPRRLASILGVMVDLIAAVPSIVVGLWGLRVLQPVFLRDVEPFMQKIPVIKFAFRGTPEGPSIFLAGVVLAIMIVPTMVALTRTALSGVGNADREAALALGATKWQIVRKIIVPGANSGILAAVTLALGRAIGETIAVALVIGNNNNFPHPFSLLSPSSTLGAVIINQFGESQQGSLLRSSLMALAVVLLAMTLLVNIAGRLMVRNKFTGRRA